MRRRLRAPLVAADGTTRLLRNRLLAEHRLGRMVVVLVMLVMLVMVLILVVLVLLIVVLAH